MRININLSSQKYEDAGEFYLRWGSALALALIITVGLGAWAWKHHGDTVSDRQRIDKLRRQIEEVDRDRAQNQAIRDRAENRDAVEQSDFWNNIIEQRQFSWTQLFSDLEKIMPGRAFVVAIHPIASEGKATSPDNRLKLELIIDGEKHDNGLELIRHMEGSPRFRFPEIQSEEIKQWQNKTSTVEFKIVTFYNPGAAVQASPAREGM
ncbi:MAG: hypothetical protein DMG65_10510 [Candidatus Angelobacter sp. Gp1-AA117]|nr:MAG: hypothetical protein DMG65_10510 [Candidatus Angelobacter sp. Gp1-AA117]